MKTLKFSLLSLLFVASSVLVSCSNDNDEPVVQKPQTVTEIAKATPDLSVLVAALVKADLAGTLDKPGEYTVFAPTNAAFTAFLKANGFADLNAVPVPALKEVLLNHVLMAKVNAADIATGYVKTMAKGSASATNTLSMYINKGDKVVINGGSMNMGATVTAVDIKATNGVIHIVDGVIGLPTIVNAAIANPNFATLVAALTFNPASGFATVLSGTTSSPFTVFAPTNAAFTSFLAETKFPGLKDIPANVLETTLKYHVVTGVNVESKSLTNGMVVKTFADQNITINLPGGAKITDASGRISNIVAVDVQCSNGIVHAIDKVLLPKF